QGVTGIIPLQFGIDFPVDLLSLCRQLPSFFGAGYEQVAVSDDAVHQDRHLFQQMRIGNSYALSAIRIGAFPAFPNPVPVAYSPPHWRPAFRAPDPVPEQVDPLQIFLEGVPLAGCPHRSSLLILLLLDDGVIFSISEVFGVSYDSCDAGFIPHIRPLAVGDLPFSQPFGNALEGSAVDVGAEYLTDDHSFILCDDCPSVPHSVTVWDIAYLLHFEVPLRQSISVNRSPPMRVTVISSRRVMRMAWTISA